jgi:hypothetical protein
MYPFDYPTTARKRIHGPVGYKDYRLFKPWLRDEFDFRCVYCLEREQWNRAGHRIFSVDHVAPSSKNPDLTCDYTNLVYSCVGCNSLKCDAELPVDPCEHGLGEHLQCLPDGTIVSKESMVGTILIQIFAFNSEPRAQQFRQFLIRLAERGKEPDAVPIVRNAYKLYFETPPVWPNLEQLRPPGGNYKSEGIRNSHFALKGKRI